MTVLDAHVHLNSGPPDPVALAANMAEAGVAGGVVISLPPEVFSPGLSGEGPFGAETRLDHLFAWMQGPAELFPFFWIDPMEADALDQVALAVERCVSGFKVIPSHHAPGDPKALAVYAAVAAAGRPMLFHAGILWDGKPSSHYCRPAAFEPLLEAAGLRFALAHVGWPWCDECIAVYGKFRSARTLRPELSAEMFIDTTPGTPPIYRHNVLRKLFGVGYEVEGNVLFGTDSSALGYPPEPVRECIDRDREIYHSLGLDAETQEGIFSDNLRRFLSA